MEGVYTPEYILGTAIRIIFRENYISYLKWHYYTRVPKLWELSTCTRSHSPNTKTGKTGINHVHRRFRLYLVKSRLRTVLSDLNCPSVTGVQMANFHLIRINEPTTVRACLRTYVLRPHRSVCASHRLMQDCDHASLTSDDPVVDLFILTVKSCAVDGPDMGSRMCFGARLPKSPIKSSLSAVWRIQSVGD